MFDVRAIAPSVQQMVDQVIPIAEGIRADGDFTVTLYIKRRDGQALVDVNITASQRKKKAST